MALCRLFPYGKIGLGPTLAVFLMKNMVLSNHSVFTYESIRFLLFLPAATSRFWVGIRVREQTAKCHIGGWGVRALATPTGKSISVSVRVVRAVRAVRAGGRGEAKLRGSVRAAMIPPNSKAAGQKSFLS